jgi:preprotein translocase subunit Sec63
MGKRFTEGIAFDGTAILDNGIPITITDILNNLNRLDKLEKERSKLRQDAVMSSVCEPCKYRFAQDYHGKMRCRDCQQGSNFEQTDL